MLLVETVAVAGYPWAPADRETVRQFERGELRRTGRGVWYDHVESSGIRRLFLYPTPSGGDTLELEWVYAGVPLKTDQPTAGPEELPVWFHPKLVHFAAEVYYETVEDNPELAEKAKGMADLAVSELIRYDNERASGSGIFEIGIVGQTA